MKNVKAFFIRKHDSGIIELSIHTTNDWAHYAELLQCWQFFIYSGRDTSSDRETLVINKELFQLREGVEYVTTSTQSRDVIVFYYIPAAMVSADEITRTRNCIAYEYIKQDNATNKEE